MGAVVGIYEAVFGLKRRQELPGVPIRGILYMFLALPCMFTVPSIIGGIGLFVSGAFNVVATVKGEEGDASNLGKSFTPTYDTSYCPPPSC